MVKTGLHGLNLRKITQRKTTFPCYIMCLRNPLHVRKLYGPLFHYWQNQFGGKFGLLLVPFSSFLLQIKNVCMWVFYTTLFCEQVHIIGFKSTWKVSDGHEAVCTADLCHAERFGAFISYRGRHTVIGYKKKANECYMHISLHADAKKSAKQISLMQKK